MQLNLGHTCAERCSCYDRSFLNKLTPTPPHLFDLRQQFDGVVVRRWVLLQLSFQTIPECFVHNLLHLALQTVQRHGRNDYFYSKKAEQYSMESRMAVSNISPSFRKLCRFDLKSLVDHYFVGQSHVGDSFSRLHQFLHRHKSRRASYEGGKVNLY